MTTDRTDPTTGRTDPGDASSLATAVLDLEGERQATDDERPVLPDDVLPGVGDDEIELRDALRIGGVFPFVLLAMLNSFDEFESAALSTLAPNIRDTLGVSDGVMVFVGSASSAFLILGSVPMGWLADRVRRARVIAWASLIFSGMVALSGLALNAFMLFLTRLGVGVAKSNTLPVHGSYLADRYPIGTRGRMGASISIAGRMAGTLSPLLVGGVAALAGGDEGWRWAFIILAVPSAVVAFLAFKLPEPPRGQFEKKGVIGRVIEDESPAPISMEAAFARIMQIRTMRSAIIAFSAIGFGLFTVPTMANIYMEDEFGLGTFARGAVGTTAGVCVLLTLPFVGRYYDRFYRRNPPGAVRLIAFVLLPAALLIPVQFFMPNAVLFAIVGVFPAVLTSAAFAMVSPLVITIVPYRLRGMGSAIGSIYLFFIGAAGGAVLSGLLVDSFGPRTTVILVYVPATITGALLFLRGAASIRGDLTMIVDEIREEQAEHDRQKADPDNIPALQVSGVDFYYGQVQILFDVGFEVRKGEVLALLGTNGAGKSTILRVVAGLGTPARGVVRMDGRTITFVSPEMRTRMGIHLLPGGQGVFGDMTVRQNLVMATYNYRDDRDEMERRIDAALALFPELADRPDAPAGSLSGGQQQLLALARILACEPEILIIDELSLGLAPIVVERLVGVVEELKAQGMTIVIVEQSLNVAMAVSDRAVFMEKGHVRFEGATEDLIERDDLARAVFLGSEGG